MLTHHPEDAIPDAAVTFLVGDVAEAIGHGPAAAEGKDLKIHSQDITRQCVERGLIDEVYVHVAPVMLGSGVRLFDCPESIRSGGPGSTTATPAQAVDLRYRPA